MESSDISPSLPSASVALSARYLRWMRGSLRGRVHPTHPWPGPWSPVDPPGMAAGDGRFSQVPGEPLCMHAPLFDPGGSARPRHETDESMLPSGFSTPSATTRSVLSRLYHAACMCAVYASRRGSPQRRARLASRLLARRWRDRTCTCWVPFSNFKAIALDLLSHRTRLILAH